MATSANPPYPHPHQLKMEPSDLLNDDSSSNRKANKPLMEKRRRARINKSLMELKSILVDNLKKSTPGHSKWEKADILEMTVQYVQSLKNQQQANKSDPLAVGQFIAGFSECIRQIRKFPPDVPTSEVGETPMDTEQDNGKQHNNRWEGYLQERLTEFLLSYLKTFSDDATKTLHPPSPVSPTQPNINNNSDLQNNNDNYGPTSVSVTSSNSPGSHHSNHHSPTSGSMSPKSPNLSPSGASSSGGSTVGDPSALTVSAIKDHRNNNNNNQSNINNNMSMSQQPYLKLSIPNYTPLPPPAHSSTARHPSFPLGSIGPLQAPREGYAPPREAGCGVVPRPGFTAQLAAGCVPGSLAESTSGSNSTGPRLNNYVQPLGYNPQQLLSLGGCPDKTEAFTAGGFTDFQGHQQLQPHFFTPPPILPSQGQGLGMSGGAQGVNQGSGSLFQQLHIHHLLNHPSLNSLWRPW